MKESIKLNVFRALSRGEILRYMGSMGMCNPKRFAFVAVLVRNRVSVLAILA